MITDAIPETVGRKLIGLVTSREEIPDLLKVNRYMNGKSVEVIIFSLKLEPTNYIYATA